MRNPSLTVLIALLVLPAVLNAGQWVATDDAPPAVKELAGRVGELRDRAIRDQQLKVQDARAAVRAAQDAVRAAKSRPLAQVGSGVDALGNRRSTGDRADAARKKQEVAAAEKGVRDATATARHETDKLADMRRDTDTPYLPPVRLAAGEVGSYGATVRVVQVLEAGDFLGSSGGQDIYFSGFSTLELVDGQEVRLDEAAVQVGTKRYATAIGASRTVVSVQAFPISRYLRPAGVKN